MQIFLPARCFFRGPNKPVIKSLTLQALQPISSPTSVVTSHKATWVPVISISVDPSRNTLRQTPTSSKLSPPNYRQFPPISSTSGYKPWCHAGTKDEMSLLTMRMSDVYHLLVRCRVHVEVGKSSFHESVCGLSSAGVFYNSCDPPNTPQLYSWTALTDWS
jgi:hypothetical protein